MDMFDLVGYLNNRFAFRAWLADDTERVVGTPTKQRWCPIATYLTSTLGGEWAVHALTVTGPGERSWQHDYYSPTWVADFVRNIDTGFGPVPVTALQCLEVLDQIGPDEELHGLHEFS